MTNTRDKTQAITIKEAVDGDTPVVLHPQNDDVFVRTGTQVIAACQLEISLDLWLKEITSLFSEVASWAQTRSEKIRSCYWVPRVGRVVFYFLPKGNQFDFDLAESLSDFNVALVNQFNVGMIELQQIPWAEAERFLDSETARCVYGDEFKSPETMEA